MGSKTEKKETGHRRLRGEQVEWRDFTEEESFMRNSNWFGQGQSKVYNSPIAGIFCRKDQHCSKVRLQTYVPDFNFYEDVPEGAQEVFENDWYWTKWFKSGSNSSARCQASELVTGVQCRNEWCGQMRLRCSSLKKNIYQTDDSFITSTNWTTRSRGKTKCEKGHYMQGMECKGRDGVCSQVRLECVQLKYKVIKDRGIAQEQEPSAPRCKDWTTRYGAEWQDADGYTCEDYESFDNFCASYGDSFANLDHTANTACCTCGGGER